MTGAMLWLEIQEGKVRISTKEHQQLGSTASCVIRGMQASEKLTRFATVIKIFYFEDSWLKSVKATAVVVQAGHYACFIIKTGYSRSPKACLEEKMKDYLGGNWMILEATLVKKKVPLIRIGYKYNKKKLLTFVITKGSGKSTYGDPYEARFPDKYGNVCVRLVRRPAILANYFKYSNCVDMHNQARQIDLAFEKEWITHDTYYILYTTMVGMTV